MDLKELRLNEGYVPDRHPWEKARMKVARSLIQTQIPGLAENANVLDMGCGDRSWLIEQLSLEFSSHTFTGIDIAFQKTDILAFNAKYKKESLPISVYQSIDDVPPDVGSFHLVLLMDVLEHIEDDQTFLRELVNHPLIPKGTYFLITLPAYQALWSSHDVFLHHYRRHSISTVSTLVKACGLQTSESGHFFWSLLPPALIQALSEKVFGKPDKASQGVGGYKAGLFDGLINTILYTDFLVAKALRHLGIRLPGLSVYCICQKPV